MSRESMRGELTLATLLYIKRVVLGSRKRFTDTGDYFLDKDDNPLPPEPASIAAAEKKNIAGAIIEAMVKLGLNEKISPYSSDYYAVMHKLAEAAQPELVNEFFREKKEAVMQVNQQGYEEVIKLIEKTATCLFHELMR